MSLQNKDGSKSVSISYDAPPFTRFVEIDICSAETSECVKHTEVFSRANLNGLPDGKLLISAKACVEPEHSSSAENCGASISETYTNNPNYSPELEELYSQRRQTQKTIDQYTSKMTEHLKTFLDESQKCIENAAGKQKAETLSQVVFAALNMGEKLVDLGIKEFMKDEKVVSEHTAASKETSSVSDEMAKADASKVEEKAPEKPWWHGKKWDDLTSPPHEAVGSLEAYIKNIKIFGYEPVPKDFALSAVWSDLLKKGHKPIDAVKFVGGSMISLFMADKLIVPQCLAEQRLKTTNASAVENLRAASKNLVNIEQAITRLGGTS